MAPDANEWLALNVLNEQHLVNYRMLSRALKTHSNLAKQALEDFHRKQNAKKPGSVYATYLITGSRKVAAHANGEHSQRDGEDPVMQSSPPLPSSSMPQPENTQEQLVIKSVLLAKEQHLEQAKATFENITGIHIYSLQTKGLGDVQSLTECNRKVAADYAFEDPLVVWKQYGVIQNPHVRRRTLGRRLAPPTALVAKDADAKINNLPPTTKPTELEEQVSKESHEPKQSSRPTSGKETPEPQKKPAALKRENSNLFKSFAKGKTKPKSESQESSAARSPAPAEDEPMLDFSDEGDADEAADDDVVMDAPKELGGKSRKDREKELQAMMEQEDEVMEDATDDGDAQDDDLGQAGAIDKPQEVQEPKETVTTEGGRRRGRRRVLKRKTVKDEDGYLVTREEAEWESFSEDEPEPKKPKMTAAAAPSKPAAVGKKGGAKGQGNIMSFFGKK